MKTIVECWVRIQPLHPSYLKLAALLWAATWNLVKSLPVTLRTGTPFIWVQHLNTSTKMCLCWWHALTTSLGVFTCFILVFMSQPIHNIGWSTKAPQAHIQSSFSLWLAGFQSLGAMRNCSLLNVLMHLQTGMGILQLPVRCIVYWKQTNEHYLPCTLFFPYSCVVCHPVIRVSHWNTQFQINTFGFMHLLVSMITWPPHTAQMRYMKYVLQFVSIKRSFISPQSSCSASISMTMNSTSNKRHSSCARCTEWPSLQIQVPVVHDLDLPVMHHLACSS